MKYKNISEFRQSIILNGKRILLEPNQVIESSRELKYIFLERVPDDTPIQKNISESTPSTFIDLKHTIEEIKDSSISTKEVEDLKKEIQGIRNTIQFLEKSLAALNNQVYNLENTIQKKTEILKNAIMTLQEDVYGITFNEKGEVIEKNQNEGDFFRS